MLPNFEVFDSRLVPMGIASYVSVEAYSNAKTLGREPKAVVVLPFHEVVSSCQEATVH